MMQNLQEFISELKGQYLLTAEDISMPQTWSSHTYQEWKLFISGLPIINVFNEQQEWIGWCIGHPVVDGVLRPEKIILKDPVDAYDPYADFYDRASGKWVLILLATPVKAVYLDAYSSLPAVFSTTEKTLAATPTLIGTEADWDEQLMAEIGYPEKIHWLPSGLTFKKNVRRLVANHCMLLQEWKVARHWPKPETDFSIDENTAGAVDRISKNIQDTITAVSKKYPICLTITGGMDSRVVLACARKHVDSAKIITFADGTENLDVFLAKRLAQQHNLNHEFLPVQQAEPEKLEQWQYRVGRSVAGDIWKIHKTLAQLDPARVLMSGQSGEVHRGNYWRPGDKADSKITAAELLKRAKFPLHPVLIKATEEWLAGTKPFSTYVMLDLVHIEQRMSCWGALQHFGNITSALEISPLGSRLVFYNMMRLPHKYRKKQQLPYDICRKLWPELLQQPFNNYPGVYGFFRSRVKRLKKMVKHMIE